MRDAIIRLRLKAYEGRNALWCCLVFLGASMGFQKVLASENEALSCPFVKPQDAPSFFLRSNKLTVLVPYHSRSIQCMMQYDALVKNKIAVNFYLNSIEGPLVGKASARLSPDRLDEQTLHAFELSSTYYCQQKVVIEAMKTAKKTVQTFQGPGMENHQEYVVSHLSIAAQVIGDDELSPLSTTLQNIEVLCPTCPMAPKGDTRVSSAVLHSKVDRAWYECARYGSTLELRLFVGRSYDEIDKMLKPKFTLKNLEKNFTLEKDKASLNISLPKEQMCQIGRYVSYEFTGKGQLKTLLSRREKFELACPK